MAIYVNENTSKNILMLIKCNSNKFSLLNLGKHFATQFVTCLLKKTTG